MHSDKKLSKEDTWRPAELRKYIRETEHGDGYMRRRGDSERKYRGGESAERQHRDQDKESRRERERLKERGDEEKKYTERRKEGSQDRRGDKGRERDKLTGGNKYTDDYRENRERKREREERHDGIRDKERHRDKEKDRVAERDRLKEEGRDNRRDDRDKERRREEQVREHRSDRQSRRHEESGERKRDETEKHHREHRDHHREKEEHRNEYKVKDREIQERHGSRKHSEQKEDKEYNEEHRKSKEEPERRHRERRHHDDKQKHDSDIKGSGQEVRHLRSDRERVDKERRHRDDGDVERKQRERKHREDDNQERKHREEEDQGRKHRERRHREDDDQERKHRERRHREDDSQEGKRREEEDQQRKHRERRHREDEDEERKHRERKHREDADQERKHRERRHREEEEHQERRARKEEKDHDRNHPDRASSKKSTSDLQSKPEMDTIETEDVDIVSEHWTNVVKDGDTEKSEVKDTDLADQEYEYEDDFEDYEEDFEEMDESTNEGEGEEEEREEITAQQRKEIEAIQRAIDEENERVGTAQSRQSTSREEEDRPKWSKGSEKNQSGSSQRGRFIDFVAAKKREVSQKVATKQKKRSTELLRLIDLDFSMTFSLLDLPPVSEYDMYIRKFGTANTKQAYVQCNEDNADRDVQTEDIEMCEKWTQHPPGYNGACGDPNLSQEIRNNATSELNFDSQRLIFFLRSASQVMVVLLEEDQAERNSLRKLKTQKDTLSFSDGSLQLNTKLPFLHGRQVSLLHFSPVQRHTMMSVHMPTTKPSAVPLDSCTVICIWNIWEPSRPQKILVYESEVKCCCFSPGKATLVFAGTSVGSVVLWDLREPASSHQQLQLGEEEWTFRQPTFSTDAVMAGLGHFSPVSSIEVAPSAVTGGLRPDVPLLASEEEMSGLSFQLASLDESGALNFWVVVELPKGNEAGSPTDLGLRPGGKVKLLHSSVLLTAERASPRDAVKTGPLQTLLLKFLPTDSNHFFIGTNMGLVNHGTSHGLKAPPKFYRFHEAEVRPVDVTSIHFSPFKHNLFLVGCGNGGVRLHVVSQERPVAEWENSTSGEPVVSLQWASTRPAVFCVLDAGSNLHIWDLLKNDAEPVISERVDADRVTTMAVFGDSGQQNTYSGVALAHESGKIEMQYFSRDLTVSSPAEEDKLESLMTEAF
ncbi:WD repeat-containing protein 60 isoform X2 [Salarias fasciatus]|uniref:WD repeat-containing protein 60 isoform X2 n=1 Tax=Salarias fasciatus TaxID=181472 RepID=UPI001176C240|nr:WD repeat-containing protein 60 isoform X2 [Salarias fasciatus]